MPAKPKVRIIPKNVMDMLRLDKIFVKKQNITRKEFGFPLLKIKRKK